MGRKASNDLFRLIHSLDSFERRLVDRHTARHKDSENLYRSLFMEIAEQNMFDNDALKVALGNRISEAHLSAAKSYLFQSVLDVLCHSGWKMSLERKLRSMLDQVEWLHSKGLSDMTMKLLEKGIKLSHAAEAFLYESEFLRWKRRLIKWKGGKNQVEVLKKIGEKEQKVLNAHFYEARLRDIRAQLQALLLIHPQTPIKVSDPIFKRLVSAPELSTQPPRNHFSSIQAFYYCKAYAALLLGNDLDARGFFLSLLTSWNERPGEIRKSPTQYLDTVSIFTDISIRQRAFKNIEKWIEKYDEVKSKDKTEEARLFFNSNHLWLRYALATGKLQGALDRSSNIEKGLVIHRQHLAASSALTFRYNLGVLHFLGDKEYEALRHFNIIRNLPVTHQRQDITDAARLIEILIHIDKGDFDTVEYLSRSVIRKNNKGSATLFRVVNKLTKSLSEFSGKQPRSLFENAFEACEKVREGSPITGQEELKIWLMSHIEKQPMEMIIRKGYAG